MGTAGGEVGSFRGSPTRAPLFKERAALQYADAITLTDRDVEYDLFEKVRGHFGEGAVVELTVAIAWENSSSKFNRALRAPSQQLWEQGNRRRHLGVVAEHDRSSIFS